MTDMLRTFQKSDVLDVIKESEGDHAEKNDHENFSEHARFLGDNYFRYFFSAV